MRYFENITNMTGTLEAANTIGSPGLWIFSVEVTVFVVLFLFAYVYGKWRALTYSSLVVGILIFYLNLADLAEWWHITIVVVAFAIGLFMSIANKNTAGN